MPASQQGNKLLERNEAQKVGAQLIGLTVGTATQSQRAETVSK